MVYYKRPIGETTSGIERLSDSFTFEYFLRLSLNVKNYYPASVNPKAAVTMRF